MKQRNLVLPALTALALAACHKPADDSNIAIDNGVNAAEAANATVETVPPSETSTPVNSTASWVLPLTIPAAFRGRWGINAADCTSTKGDAKGLLTIGEAGLTFYEANGALAKVMAATATRFDARYSFAGEGQTWKRTERFSLVDGQLQRRTDPEPGQEPPVNLNYARCAG